jgi:hypothetical protein
VPHFAARAPRANRELEVLMRFALLSLALLLSAPLAPALAQESACVTIENDAERLACYDAANGRTPRATPQLPVAAPQGESDRGGFLPSIGGLISGDGDSAVLPPVQMQVARVQRRAGGHTDFVMTNDETWSTRESLDRLPRIGEQVTVQRVAIGLFLLTPQTGEPFRVRKL